MGERDGLSKQGMETACQFREIMQVDKGDLHCLRDLGLLQTLPCVSQCLDRPQRLQVQCKDSVASSL